MSGLEVIALFSGPVAWVGLWDRSAPRRWGGGGHLLQPHS